MIQRAAVNGHGRDECDGSKGVKVFIPNFVVKMLPYIVDKVLFFRTLVLEKNTTQLKDKQLSEIKIEHGIRHGSGVK